MDASFLFASLVWGMIGGGYFMYGKKQSAVVPLVGGVVLIAVSYFIGSALYLSLASIGIIVAMHWLMRQGY